MEDEFGSNSAGGLTGGFKPILDTLEETRGEEPSQCLGYGLATPEIENTRAENRLPPFCERLGVVRTTETMPLTITMLVHWGNGSSQVERQRRRVSLDLERRSCCLSETL